MTTPMGTLHLPKSTRRPVEDANEKTERSERMVIRQTEADGSIRYIVTEALLRRAAKAASRKNFEAV